MKRFAAPILATLALTTLLVAGCAAIPGGGQGATSAAARAGMVAAIRAWASADGEGLVVQPLRDPRVEDLRADAGRLEASGDIAAAAQRLDEALEIVPDDPAVLQERAEVAVLQGDFKLAAGLAERAWTLGAQVGPLCQRHQATLEQLRLADGDAAGAAAARDGIAACRVAGPARY